MSAIIDSSGNGYHGTFGGSNFSTTKVQGKIGQGMSFSASDTQNVSTGIISQLSSATNATLSVWVKKGASEEIAAGQWVNPYRFNFVWSASSNNIYLEAENGVSSFPYFSPVNTEGWHHLVMVYDGTQSGINRIKAYWDGNIQSLSPDGADPASSLASSGNQGLFLLGRDGDNGYSNGSLDDVRLYNRSLTESEAKALYNSAAAKFSTSQTPSGLKNGLVGHWTFDGKDMTTNVKDVSGQGNNGSLQGQTSTTSVAGKIGQALSFDGTDDHVTFTAPDITNSSFSISSWIMTRDQSSRAWFSIGTQSETNKQIHLVYSAGNNLRFGFYSDDSDFSYSLANNKMYHVVFIHDNTTGLRTLYVNGVSQGTDPGSAYTGNTSSRIGGWAISPVSWDYWNGAIDDTRIYNKALTSAEVGQLYSMGAGTKVNTPAPVTGTGLTSGLVSYWTFDGKDTTDKAYDRVGGAHADFMNGPMSRTMGKMGQAFNFNTSSYLDASTFSWPGGPVTVAFWNYVESVPVTAGSAFGLQGRGSSSRFQSHSPWSDGSLYWDYGNIFGSGRLATSYSAYVGKWTHVVLTSGGGVGGMGIYFNGELAASTGVSEDSGSGTGLDIGRNYENPVVYNHLGKLDDFRIYNRVLSASEIKALYNIGK